MSENQAIENLKQMLLQEEGCRQFPYHCTAGKLTIGIGRNLEDKGISKQEAEYLLANDIQYFQEKLISALPFFNNLDEVRQAILIDMAFNLGVKNLLAFKQTLSYISKQNYKLAAEAMLDSKWAEQVRGRAIKLANMMETGQWI